MKIYRERHVYFFTCEGCGVENRQSFKRKKARDGKCRNCRRNHVNKDQLPIFA